MLIDARRTDPVCGCSRFLLQCPRDSAGGQRDLPRRRCWADHPPAWRTPASVPTITPSRPARTPIRHPRRPLDRPRIPSWPRCVRGSRLPNPIGPRGHCAQPPRIRSICFYPPCCARRIEHSSIPLLTRLSVPASRSVAEIPGGGVGFGGLAACVAPVAPRQRRHASGRHQPPPAASKIGNCGTHHLWLPRRRTEQSLARVVPRCDGGACGPQGHRADYGRCGRLVNGIRADHASPAERGPRPAIARTTVRHTSGEAVPGTCTHRSAAPLLIASRRREI